jgi:molybdate transport repressor ModE-like protein
MSFQVSISPVWTIRHPDGQALAPRVVELLVMVDEHGSLAAACTAIGASYRHAWQLLREGEALFGQPLLVMARGKGSQLTALGARLVWAQRRVHARLSPLLDTLASELGTEIEKALSVAPSRLRIHASHGFAVQAMHEFLDDAGLAHELKYCGSAEALAALSSGSCDVAGFHVPMEEFEPVAVEHYRPWLQPGVHRVVQLARRRQGLMVAPGNPKRIYGIGDLARPDIRFINRQAGSGTRYLLDLMLQARGIEAAAIRGYEQCEFTHAAVAAFVASGMADAGLGVEVPAREFKLEFLPMHQERYFLLCDEKNLGSPDMLRLLDAIRGEGYRQAVNRLPGYEADAPGTVVTVEAAFPSFEPGSRRQR